MIKKAVLFSLVLVVCGSAAIWSSSGHGQVPATKDPIKPIMQRKLDYAKALLEALAKEELDKVSRNAQALSLLSLESAWNTIVTEEYLKQSNAFRNSLNSMREASKEGNVDRAALGYVDMTIRCIDCHKYLRSKGAKSIDRSAG